MRRYIHLSNLRAGNTNLTAMAIIPLDDALLISLFAGSILYGGYVVILYQCLRALPISPGPPDTQRFPRLLGIFLALLAVLLTANLSMNFVINQAVAVIPWAPHEVNLDLLRTVGVAKVRDLTSQLNGRIRY